MQETITRKPKLLKSRMAHSRIFCASAIVLMICSGTHHSGNIPALKIMWWGGYALVLIGALIRIYYSLYIGGRKNDELVTDGPFSVVRNQLYLGSFIAVLGIGLQSTSISILCILIAGFISYYPFVILREEELLTHIFASRYLEYKAATPRLIPRLSLWHSPHELVCKPYFVLRTIYDSAAFFLPLPFIDAINTLHNYGILPVFWVLP